MSLGHFNTSAGSQWLQILFVRGKSLNTFMILRYFSFVPDLHWVFPWPQTNILRWSLSSFLLHSSIILFHFFPPSLPVRFHPINDSDFQRKLSPCKIDPFYSTSLFLIIFLLSGCFTLYCIQNFSVCASKMLCWFLKQHINVMPISFFSQSHQGSYLPFIRNRSIKSVKDASVPDVLCLMKTQGSEVQFLVAGAHIHHHKMHWSNEEKRWWWKF